MRWAMWVGAFAWMLVAGRGISMAIDDQTYQQLESESQETRNAAIAKAMSDRQVETKKVAELFKKHRLDDRRKGTAKDALLLLGKLRAAEYVGLLVENLTFQVFYLETNRPQITEDLYPAVKALIDIGSPAADAVLARLKKEDGEDLQRTGATVLRGVLGEQWAGVILEYEIGAAGSGAVSERLRQVLQQLKHLPN